MNCDIIYIYSLKNRAWGIHEYFLIIYIKNLKQFSITLFSCPYSFWRQKIYNLWIDRFREKCKDVCRKIILLRATYKYCISLWLFLFVSAIYISMTSILTKLAEAHLPLRDFLAVLKNHWRFSAVFCSLAGFLSLWHIPYFGQFYFKIFIKR